MTVQVAVNQVADCSITAVLRQQMFCRRRCSECSSPAYKWKTNQRLTRNFSWV